MSICRDVEDLRTHLSRKGRLGELMRIEDAAVGSWAG